jgi:hypothetical protein
MKKTILFVLAAMLLVVSSAFAQTTDEAVKFDATTFYYLNNWGDASKSVEDMLNSLDGIECESFDEDNAKVIVGYYEDDTEIDVYTYTFYEDALRSMSVLIMSEDTDSLDLETIAQTLIDAYDLTSIESYDTFYAGIDEAMEDYGFEDGEYSAGATDDTIAVFAATVDDDYESPMVLLQFFDRQYFESAE